MATIQQAIEVLIKGRDDGFKPKADEVIAKIKEMEAAEKAAAAEADKLAKGVENVGDKADSVRGLGDAFRALATGLVVNAFIGANLEIERFEKGIRAIKGSSADTGKELDYVRGVAERFGVELGSVTRSYVSLTAATIGTNLEGDKTRAVFEAVTKAMGATGKSSAETEGALKAIEQIAGKGKVQMEELRGQLGDRLPGAMQIAARALGTTTEGFEELVKKGLSASDFLPLFAEELNRTFAGASFDGYSNSLARLRNAIDAAFVNLGDAGAFDGLIRGVNALTAILTGSISSVKLFGETIGSFMLVLNQASTGDFGIFSADWSGFGDRFKESLDKAANSTKSLTDALAGTKEATGQAARNIDEYANETAKLQRQNKAAGDSTRELDELLKRLGVSPKAKTDIDEIAKALGDLVNNDALKGGDFLSGFEAALKRVRTNDDLNAIGGSLTDAFIAGKLSAEEFAIGVNDLAKAQARVEKATADATSTVDDNAKSMKAAAKESREAEGRAQNFRLEMEKLASNERIKAIEAKVTLDIANVEANTERVKAMLESIDNTVNSTGQLISDLFGEIGNQQLDWGAKRLIEEQIRLENQRRQEALELQKKITEAQIDYLNAQTRSIDRGDALIKIDGAGLQPHLEAFMWEILRTIQTRVNQDGLKYLLGVT